MDQYRYLEATSSRIASGNKPGRIFGNYDRAKIFILPDVKTADLRYAGYLWTLPGFVPTVITGLPAIPFYLELWRFENRALFISVLPRHTLSA
jgi:hypothetical protein